MGCGSSLSRDVQSVVNRHGEVNKKVHIEKGNNANLRSDNKNIVFVFGEL